SFALFARHIDVGEKVHFDGNDPVSLARFTPTAFYIERKAARLESTCLRIRHHCEQVADEGKQSGVGGRIGPWRATDRRLVDLDDFVDESNAFDTIVPAGLLPSFLGGAGGGCG